MRSSHSELLRTLDPIELGARVRAAREARGWTQTDLADGDVSVGYVSRIENGSRRPKLDVLATLAQRLDVPLNQLLEDTGAREYDEIRLGLDYTELALESGETREAEQQAREFLARADSTGQTELSLRARLLLARALESLGDLDAAITELEQVAGAGSGLLLAEAGIALCRCYRETGDFALAIETGDRILASLAEAGLERTDEAIQLTLTVASSHIMRGDLHRAARICEATLQLAEEVATPKARASANWEASMVHARRGDLASASRLASRAVALLSEGQDARNLARLRLQTATLRLRAEPDSAAEVLAQLAEIRVAYVASSASQVETARVDVAMAEAHLLAGETTRAMTIAATAVDAVDEHAVQLRVEALVVRGQALAAEGRADEARTTYRDAVTVLTGAGADRSAAQLWFELAELLDEIGDAAAAHDAYRSAAAASGLMSRRPAARVVPTSV